MGLLSGGLTGDEDTNILDDGLTGDEDTSVVSEGWTGNEDSNIASFDGAADAVSNAATIESLQEVGQRGTMAIHGADSKEEAAQEAQELYTAPKQAIGQTVENAVEGTAADNWVTDKTVAVTETGAEWVFEAPVRGAAQMAGIDPKTGEAVDEVDAGLAADTAITVGTLGSGKMLTGLGKGVGKLLSGSDEAANFARRSDGLVGQSGIDEAATSIGTKAENARHPENLSDVTIGRAGASAVKTGGDDTTAAWTDAIPTGSGSAADDVASGADDLSASIRNTIGAGSNTLQTALSTTTGKVTAAALGVGGGVALAGTGLNAAGALPEAPGSDVAREVIEVFDQGGKLVEFRKGESVAGYGVLLGVDPKTELLGVLDQDGKLRRVPKSSFSSRFDSQESARDAYFAYLESREPGSGEGPLGVHNLPKSSEMTGGIDLPSSAPAGQGFDIHYSLISDVGAESVVQFGLSTQSGIVPLAEKSLVFPAGEEVSGTVTVPQGATGVSPGTYPVVAFAMNEDVKGIITSEKLKVTGGEKKSKWETPKRRKTLDFGWHLLSQTTKDGEKTRFTVASRNKKGEIIYLHPDGKARVEPYTYDKPADAAEGMQNYKSRLEANNVTEDMRAQDEQPRPKVGDVKADLDAYDRSSVSGLASTVSSALSGGPLMVGLGAFGLVLIGLVILG